MPKVQDRFPDSNNFLYSYYSNGNISEIKSGASLENYYYERVSGDGVIDNIR